METREKAVWGFRWQLVATVLMAALVFGYLAHMKGTFNKHFELRLQVDSAVGLTEGMKVTYKGFELGRLHKLSLLPHGQIDASIQVRPTYASFFTQGAVLRLSKEKIVTSELVLIRDEGNQAAIPYMGSISVVKEDVAADVTKRLDPLLNKLQQLLTQLSDPSYGIQASLGQSRLMMLQTGQTLELTSRAMRQLSDEDHGLPAVLGQTRDTMIQLEKSLAQTQRTLETADGLIKNVDGTVSEVKSAPLYKWLVPQKQEAHK